MDAPGAVPPPLAPLPAVAAWPHRDARQGFAVARCVADGNGWRLEGSTSAAEDGVAWVVGYRIELDGAGGWTVDGRPVPAVR